MLGSHELQVVTAPEQVEQGDVHATQIKLTEAVPTGHVTTQRFPLRLVVLLQEVQLDWDTEHVAQLPRQGIAMPDTLTYPEGTVLRH